jgi:hypothetical protein
LANLLQECRESDDVDEAFRTTRRMTSLAQMAQLIGLDETSMTYISGWDELHSDEFVPREAFSFYWLAVPASSR